MLLKTMGAGLVLAGIVNTGLGLFALTREPALVERLAFGALVVGALCYLSGLVSQAIDERARRERSED